MEKTVKIKFHSFVDVITNSSTVIYTYQSSAIEPVKEVLNEILRLQGVNKKADDLFYFGVFCDSDVYEESKECPFKDEDYKEISKEMKKLINDILVGAESKPGWMTDAETNDCDGWNPSCSLHIKPKDANYQYLTDTLLKFLNSPFSDGGRDG